MISFLSKFVQEWMRAGKEHRSVQEQEILSIERLSSLMKRKKLLQKMNPVKPSMRLLP